MGALPGLGDLSTICIQAILKYGEEERETVIWAQALINTPSGEEEKYVHSIFLIQNPK